MEKDGCRMAKIRGRAEGKIEKLWHCAPAATGPKLLSAHRFREAANSVAAESTVSVQPKASKLRASWRHRFSDYYDRHMFGLFLPGRASIMANDESFEPRLGRMRAGGSGKRARKFLHRVLGAANLARGGAATGRGRSGFTGSRIGRGAGVAACLSAAIATPPFASAA